VLVVTDETSDYLETLYSLDLTDFEQEGYVDKSDRYSTYVVLYTHCLPSFLDLVEFIIKNGFLAGNIFVIPKLYSAIPSAVEKLNALGVKILDYHFSFEVGKFDESARRHVASCCLEVQKFIRRQAKLQSNRNRVILVDDGGFLTESWNKICSGGNTDAVSVQQTASGMYNNQTATTIPYINVAQSAAKRWFEAKIIATGLLSKVSSIGEIDYSKKIGVAGYGAVGRALVNLLQDNGAHIIVHDVSNRNVPALRKFRFVSDQKAFLQDADIVFGCVGLNWISRETAHKISGSKTLISCSSRDVEFSELFQTFEHKNLDGDPFSDMLIYGKSKFHVLNAGFPVNFDRKVEYEKLSEIVITRALILAAVLQARCVRPGRYSKPIKLSCAIQRQIVRNWLEHYSSETGYLGFGVTKEQYESIDWWYEESIGKRYLDF